MTSSEDARDQLGPSPCLPRFARDEPEGIKISLPDRFRFSEAATRDDPDTLSICLSIKLVGANMHRFEHIFRHVKIVVTDDERQEVFTGGVWRDRHYLPFPPRPPRADVIEPTESVEYNTVNLLEFIPLPRRPAKYNIYALLEEHKSNVVTVQVDVP